ncbi:MAG: glycosyl hydrolase family 28-related protein [Gemmatimonadaceae bacterium]
MANYNITTNPASVYPPAAGAPADIVAHANDHGPINGFVELFDTTMATPATGNVPVWNGTGWAPAVPASASGTATGWLNVKAAPYNAAGDGTTNDAGAIQAALTAANTAGGGVVFLPPGTYIINRYLLIYSNTYLRGSGMGVTTIKCGSGFTAGGTAPLGGGYSMLQTNAASGMVNVAVSDLTFDGNESVNRATLSGAGNRVSSYLVDMRGVTGLAVDRVATRNTWTYNIVVFNCSRFRVTQCDVQSVNTSGVYNQMDGIHILGSNQGRIVGNHVDNGIGSDADDGLVAHVIAGGQPCYDLVYANNVVRGGANGDGIQVAGDAVLIRDITIIGNVFWGCRRGIFTNFYAASGNQPIRGLSIVGNTLRDGTLYEPIFIHLYADGKWEDVTIADNIIDGYGSAAQPSTFAISVEGGNGSRGISITGNTMRNGWSRAIFLSEGAPLVQDYVIANNIIDMQAASASPLAVILGSSKDGIFSGNVLTGRGTADGVGVYVDSTVAAQATNQIIHANRVRAFNTGIQVTNGAGNNPTNTIVTSNITQGCTTGLSFGTATVTSANNL